MGAQWPTRALALSAQLYPSRQYDTRASKCRPASTQRPPQASRHPTQQQHSPQLLAGPTTLARHKPPPRPHPPVEGCTMPAVPPTPMTRCGRFGSTPPMGMAQYSSSSMLFTCSSPGAAVGAQGTRVAFRACAACTAFTACTAFAAGSSAQPALQRSKRAEHARRVAEHAHAPLQMQDARTKACQGPRRVHAGSAHDAWAPVRQGGVQKLVGCSREGCSREGCSS